MGGTMDYRSVKPVKLDDADRKVIQHKVSAAVESSIYTIIQNSTDDNIAHLRNELISIVKMIHGEDLSQVETERSAEETTRIVANRHSSRMKEFKTELYKILKCKIAKRAGCSLNDDHDDDDDYQYYKEKYKRKYKNRYSKSSEYYDSTRYYGDYDDYDDYRSKSYQRDRFHEKFEYYYNCVRDRMLSNPKFYQDLMAIFPWLTIAGIYQYMMDFENFTELCKEMSEEIFDY